MTANTTVKKLELPELSVKKQTFAAIAAICSAVILPQVLHTFGVFFGVGSALGEMLLPMQLPVLLVGFLAGPYAGLITGFLAPIISFALTGMPGVVMLPFITAELLAYGVCAGMLRGRKIPVIGKVFLAQLAGRVLRATAVLCAVYVFGSTEIAVTTAFMNIKTGIWGIVLQLILIPAIVYGVRKASENERRCE